MPSLRFGTDGVRGVANSELTAEYTTALGRAAAHVLGADRFVVGRDTRRSGPLLEAALCAGLASEGIDTLLLGVAPTPAVAHLAEVHGWAGAMVSASHNPFADNGIKLFAPGGLKLTPGLEGRIEASLAGAEPFAGAVPIGAAVGAITAAPELLGGYEDSVVDSIEGRSLAGLRIVVDCASGSNSEVGPRVLRRLGAELIVLHASPDGININERSGSTHPEDLQRVVVESGSDLGVAFDGDADRVLAVDHTGRLIDGDHLIAMCATDYRDRGLLASNSVVVTVMTNLGFRLAMERQGISVVETAVGDRHVLEALEHGSLTLGGEQSGHVIFRSLATTGDGLLTAVQLADLVNRAGEPLAVLSDRSMTRLPQVLVNVRVVDRDVDIVDKIRTDIEAAEAQLGDRGRVLIRVSGTEPLVRVMVEAPEIAEAEQAAQTLVAAVQASIGDGPGPETKG